MWRRRREENDLAAAADPLFKKHKFDVHDLKQVIASKGLHTEDIRCLDMKTRLQLTFGFKRHGVALDVSRRCMLHADFGASPPV